MIRKAKMDSLPFSCWRQSC